MIDNKCPRRFGFPDYPGLPETDEYHPDDHSCTYCGSLNPDVFMARLEVGDVELTPTDKSYKVYINNNGGEPFVRRYRRMDDDPQHPVFLTEQVQETKFYFSHLSTEQKQRFIELHNEGKLKLRYPHHFYTCPFFMTWKEPE